ncbi:cytokine receptor-like [Schistocerca serialis cubense]|uniref:cytokine receptor-like n=1 Tax=Schistocerca serialis cubense TaxID=2023355 RepID=UPI00214EB116|nr:cytokine receptor-like [Schistocerca serialis cubense]
MPRCDRRAWASAPALCLLLLLPVSAQTSTAAATLSPAAPTTQHVSVTGGKCMTGLDFHGYTVPKGRIVVEYGSSLEIYCFIDPHFVATKGRNASDIRFYRNATPLPEEYIQVLNATTARLLEPHPEVSSSKYYCRLHQGGKKQSLLCLNEVVVAYKPQPVDKFSCLSWNWESLNCTWTAPENPLRTRYKIMYALFGRGTRWVYKCPQETEDSGYCYWDTRTDPMFRPTHQYIAFMFTGSNDLGNVTFPRIKFHVFAHVLPAKPLYLVSEDITTNSALLQWDIAMNMKKFPPGLDRKIQYKSVCDPSDAWETADTSQLEKMSTNYTLTGLRYPNALYDVRLYLKSPMATGDHMWSEPASHTFKTLPTVPSFPPKTDSGSFHIIGRLNRRDIIIYWQRIPRCSENGDDFSYDVSSVEQNGKLVNIKPNKIGKSYAQFDQLTTDSYTFRIVSTNKEGPSEESSVVHVPSKQTLPPTPTGFTKYVNEKGVIQLSWNHPSDKEWAGMIDSYTVFWCQNDRDGPNHCSGFLNWTRVSKDVRTMNITVREGKVYEFAISSNTNTSSSGMIWATCTLRPNSGLEKVKEIEISSVGSTYIEVHFEMECQNRLQNVSQYNIYYCPIVSPHNATCRTEEEVLIVRGHNVSVQANITSLQPYTTYMIYVAREANGIMSDASNLKYTTTLEAAPTIPLDVTVTGVTNDSMTVSWVPPLSMNGKLNHYDVLYNHHLVELGPEEKESVTLRNLSSYTVYNVYVRACTMPRSLECSNYTEPVTKRTEIGLPGTIERPVAHVQNFSRIVFKWKAPDHAGGKLDYYQVWVQPSDDANATRVYNITATQAANRTADIKIPECRDPNRIYRLAIRAVNVNDQRPKRSFFGPWSEWAEAYCSSVDPIEMTTIVTWCVVSVSILVFFFIVGYLMWKLVAWFNVAHKIEVKLPPGLAPLTIDKEKEDGYHMNVPWQIYSIRDAGKAGGDARGEPDCTLLGSGAQRSPSGDSSGCSSDRDCPSSSLTTATRVSSATDSGAEADGERCRQTRPLSCLFSADYPGAKAAPAAASWSTPDLTAALAGACLAPAPAVAASALGGSARDVPSGGGEPYCRAGYLPSPPPPPPPLAASRGYVSVASVSTAPKQPPPLTGSGSVDDWLSALEAAEVVGSKQQPLGAEVDKAAAGRGYVSLPFASGVATAAPAASVPGYVTLASLPARGDDPPPPAPPPAQEDVPPFIRQRMADMRALRRRRRADQRPEAASDPGVIIPAKDVEADVPAYYAPETEAAPDYVKLSYVQCRPDSHSVDSGTANSEDSSDERPQSPPVSLSETAQTREAPSLLMSFR